MTDEEYLFHQDVKQKKKISYGAFHKVNGSRSKKCNFPSDYMTKKEILKMNSEPITYDLKKFYTYEEFKQMPKEIATEYIQRLTDTYHVGVRTISSVLFGLGESTFAHHLRTRLIYDSIKWNSFSGSKGAAYAAQFKRDIEAAKTETKIEVEQNKNDISADVDVKQVEPEKKVSKKKDSMASENETIYISKHQPKIVNAEITFDGFDLETFLFLAKKYEGKEVAVKLSISGKETVNE